MDPAAERLIAALHAAPMKCVLALTGGGASAASALLAVPGASRTVLECVIPYHGAALCEFLGDRPPHFCSADTARAMARRAAARAEHLAPGEPVLGLGCTASLATDRPKRGDHRFHVGVSDDRQVRSISVTLTKGARDRAGEERVVLGTILNALAEAFGVPGRVEAGLLPGEQAHVATAPAPGLLAAFQRGEVSQLCQEADGQFRADGPAPPALLCGSFNPLHAGHQKLAEVARARLGVPVAFELGAVNADKPPLTAAEIRRRLRQLVWQAPVWVTRSPTFAEKARHFPGTAFIVGIDTAARVIDARFYGGSTERMREALAGIQTAGCRFLVAGRVDAGGRFTSLADVPVPDEFRELFTEIPESEFRLDLSSTQLRENESVRFTRPTSGA